MVTVTEVKCSYTKICWVDHQTQDQNKSHSHTRGIFGAGQNKNGILLHGGQGPKFLGLSLIQKG